MRRVLLVQSTAERYGSDRAARSLARRLPAHGWAVTVAVPDEGPLVADLRAADVQVVVADPAVLRRVLTPAGWVRLAAWHLPRAVVRYRRLASAADVVHVNTSVSLGALVGARLARRPVVVHLRESYAGSRRLFAAYARLLRRLATTVVAISDDIAAEASAAGLGDLVRLVHDGIELPEPSDGRDGAPTWDVVCVGRINGWKGQDVLVDAVADLHDRGVPLRTAIAGDVFPGGEGFRAALEEQIARRRVGELVHLLGFVDDVGALLRASTMFVLPSTRPEPFGLALVEAMAAGLPCVATAAGGPRDVLVDGVSGLLVPPGDAVVLADALAKLHDDAELRGRLGAAAAATVAERFTADRAAAAVAAIYDEVMRRS